MTTFPHFLTLSGMSESECAELLDVTKNTVGKWKSGKMVPPSSVIVEMTKLVELIKANAAGENSYLPYDSCYEAVDMIELLNSI